MIGDNYDTDPNDIVYALFGNECVGMANVDFDDQTNKAKVFLTVHGNDDMARKSIRFQLWQASTGMLSDLSTDRDITFAHGFVYGCGDGEPIIMTVSGNETQSISLIVGWTWVSTHLDLSATKVDGGRYHQESVYPTVRLL